MVDSLKEANNIITASNNITLRKVNVQPSRFDKMYMDKNLIENKFYQTTNQFREKKITPVKFSSTHLNKIHQFHDRNDRRY